MKTTSYSLPVPPSELGAQLRAVDDTWKGASACTIRRIRQCNSITDLVPYERHVGIQKPRCDKSPAFPGKNRHDGIILQYFTNADLGPQMHCAFRTFTRPARILGHTVGVSYRTTKAERYAFTLIVIQRLGIADCQLNAGRRNAKSVSVLREGRKGGRISENVSNLVCSEC